jgi:hypothetical protein
LVLPLLLACTEPTDPPVGIYPPNGRYDPEFFLRGDDGQVVCSGSVVVDFVLDRADVSGSYGVTGPGTFGCGSGEPHVIGNGAGAVGGFEYTDTGFEFDFSSPAWRVEAKSSGPESFNGTFRFVLPAAGGDSVVVGSASGLRARG